MVMIDIEHPYVWGDKQREHFLKMWQECLPEKLKNSNKIPIIYGTPGNCFKCGIPLDKHNLKNHQENCNFIPHDE